MGTPIDREGIFRGNVKSYRHVKGKSGAMGIELTCDVLDYLDGGTWTDWAPHGFEAEGTVWYLKKNGSLNDRAVETLRDVLEWDGKIESVMDGSWKPPAIQFTVKWEADDKGRSRLKISYFNPWDYKGQMGDADIAAWKQDIGPKLRAMFGSKAHNPPPPPPKPAAPPIAARKTLPPLPSKNGVAKNPTATMEEAWAVFGPEADRVYEGNEEKITATWNKALAKLVPGKDQSAFTGEDWFLVKEKAVEDVIPF